MASERAARNIYFFITLRLYLILKTS